MKKDVYNLSKPQESIWLTEQYFKNTNINRIISIADFSAKIDNLNFELLNQSINNTVKSNDNFQTRLFLENGEIKQYYSDFEEFKCEIIEVSSIEELIEEDRKRKNIFNLIESPLYEFKLFKLKETNTGGILANFHHIICDGFTAALCVRQIFESYKSLIEKGNLPELNPNGYSYTQYLNSEREYVQSKKFIKDKEYWEQVFETIPEVATIYSNKKAQNIISPEAERETYIIDKDLMIKIKNLCDRLKISVYNFFMAVFGIYISRSSRLDDFVIGTPILNRANYREKNTLGMYVSTVPFRIKVSEELTFSEYVKNIAKETMTMLRHQKYSYGYIIEELRKKSSNVPNLYNILFSYQISKAADANNEYSADWLSNHTVNGDLDIHIYDLNDKNSASVSYDYNINKYDKKDIEGMHPRILYIIHQILENSEILVGKIDIVTPKEKMQILKEFNNTKTDYPKDKNVISIFEEQAKKTPNAPAVWFEGESLTYAELNRKANALANHLKQNGVTAGDVVSMCLDKSLEVVISVVAILKTGAIYLPIDVTYPEERILYMIDNSKSKAVLISSKINLDLKLDIPIINVDLSEKLYENNTEFKTYNTKPTDGAYVIYTSGSTGTPKGILVPNKAVIRLVKNTNYMEFKEGTRLLQTGSLAFDVSTFEFWGSLLNGIELFLIKKNDLLNPKVFRNYIEKNKIDSLFISTALFNKYSEEDPRMFGRLTYVIIGGEALSYKHIKNVREANPDLNIINGYGPAENTTYSTYLNIKDLSLGFIPIGYPVANSTCYVVSPSGCLQPEGFPGELWVGGDRTCSWIFEQRRINKRKIYRKSIPEKEEYIKQET